MIKRLLFAFMTLCASVCVLSGCNKDDDKETPSAEKTWESIVADHSWLNEFPAPATKFTNIVYSDQGQLETAYLYSTETSESVVNEYSKKLEEEGFLSSINRGKENCLFVFYRNF